MKEKIIYQCRSCGYIAPGWIGKCPVCNEWESIEEIKSSKNQNKSKLQYLSNAKKLSDIEINKNSRYKSGIGEFNRVIGGGLIIDSVSILAAKPGSGKSTLLLELAYDYSKQGLKILYLSGEESESQIKSRALRIMPEIPDKIWLLSTNSMDLAIDAIERIDPDIVFLDSIQTFLLSEHNSKQGSPVQTVECTNKLVEIAKNPEKPKAVVIIGHMTKSDEMAGLRTLEHMVDTVLFIESDMSDDLRILLSTKNRFGRTGEIGLFRMQENGFKELKDPSDEFITRRDSDIKGSAVALIREGSRYIAVEIESLVSNSFQPYPIRIGECVNKNRLNTLIAILEQRAGIKLYDKNVIIKTTGGLDLKHQDSDLAILMSIASSVVDKPIDNKTAFVAEVGLTGELKPVKQMDQRISELQRLGYKSCYYADNGRGKIIELENFKAVPKKHITEVLKEVFDNH
ncbi:MAG: DNA repair protein RadA [Tissierellia bacterium]|nr:DNA repair protein RadA [Tissierellia bacterium]